MIIPLIQINTRERAGKKRKDYKEEEKEVIRDINNREEEKTTKKEEGCADHPLNLAENVGNPSTESSIRTGSNKRNRKNQCSSNQKPPTEK